VWGGQSIGRWGVNKVKALNFNNLEGA